MKQILLLISIVALAFGCNTSPSATQPVLDMDEIQKVIENEIEKSLEATRYQDIEAYMGLIPDDFIIYDESGEEISRAQQRAYIQRDWSIIDTTLALSMTVDSMNLVRPDSAIVFTSQDWERIMFQRDGVTTDTVRTTQVHRETWKLTQKGWYVYDILELGGKIYINGEPYYPER